MQKVKSCFFVCSQKGEEASVAGQERVKRGDWGQITQGLLGHAKAFDFSSK